MHFEVQIQLELRTIFAAFCFLFTIRINSFLQIVPSLCQALFSLPGMHHSAKSRALLPWSLDATGG